MNVDDKTLKYYEQYYFANETPVPFQVKDNNYILHIRPVKVSMFPFYHDNVGILCIDKNRISDAKIISMSYLQYLVDIVCQQKEYQQALLTILNISIGEEYQYTLGHFDNGKPYLGIYQNDTLLCRVTAKEFDKISEIILYYNNRDYDGRYISTENVILTSRVPLDIKIWIQDNPYQAALICILILCGVILIIRYGVRIYRKRFKIVHF